MLYVLDLQDSALPDEFLATLPTQCDTCGSDTEITETLSMLRCSNPSCLEKSVQRMVALLKDLGVKNMGESKCQSFLEHWGITNPLAIFMYEPSDGVLYDGCSMDFSEAMFEQMEGKRKMLLWEYVKYANLPGIRDSARKLLASYDSLEEFYDDVENGGISFVQELLSIKGKAETSTGKDIDDEEGNNAVSVTAVDVYNTLIFFKSELFEALPFVEIKQLTTEMVNICISTAVGKPYGSKSDFVAQMNQQFGDKIHLNFLGSVSNECQFLIWSKEGAPTSKVTKVERINEKRRAKNIAQGLPEDNDFIHIMTGAEFREYLSTL